VFEKKRIDKRRRKYRVLSMGENSVFFRSDRQEARIKRQEVRSEIHEKMYQDPSIKK